MELQGLLFLCTFFVVVASCKQQEQNVTDLQRIKPQIFRPHTLLFLLLSLLLFSAWRTRQYLHAQSSTSSLCWANLTRPWRKKWVAVTLWPCSRVRERRGARSIHYVNMSTQSALTRLCEMNAYTDVKNTQQRWRKNGVLQTPCSSTVEFPGWFKFLIKTGVLCDVWYTCCASTSSHYNLLWFRFFSFFLRLFSFPPCVAFLTVGC